MSVPLSLFIEGENLARMSLPCGGAQILFKLELDSLTELCLTRRDGFRLACPHCLKSHVVDKGLVALFSALLQVRK